MGHVARRPIGQAIEIFPLGGNKFAEARSRWKNICRRPASWRMGISTESPNSRQFFAIELRRPLGTCYAGLAEYEGTAAIHGAKTKNEKRVSSKTGQKRVSS